MPSTAHRVRGSPNTGASSPSVPSSGASGLGIRIVTIKYGTDVQPPARRGLWNFACKVTYERVFRMKKHLVLAESGHRMLRAMGTDRTTY